MVGLYSYTDHVKIPAPKLCWVLFERSCIRLSQDFQGFAGMYKGSECRFHGSTGDFHYACVCCIYTGVLRAAGRCPIWGDKNHEFSCHFRSIGWLSPASLGTSAYCRS